MKINKLVSNLAFTIALIYCAFLGNSFAQTSEPILRIETGSHTQMITSIAVDDNNRYFVSASKDKTLRVWDLETEKLLRVLRVPIERGNYGQLKRVEISPDGSIVAAICNESVEAHEWTVFLFETVTGKIIKRIDNKTLNPQGENEQISVTAIDDIKFSRNGNEIALFGSGLAIYSLKSRWVEFKEETFAGGLLFPSDLVDFDSKGNLAIADLQNQLRIYSKSSGTWKQVKLIKFPSPISSLIFSPDGTKLGVSFWDLTEPPKSVFQIYSTNNYLLTNEIINFIPAESLISAKVAEWSLDSKTIISLSFKGLLIWDIDKTKSNPLIKTNNNIFQDFAVLKSGRIVFATFDGKLGFVDSKGQIDFIVNDSFFSLEDYESTDFQLSPNGLGVQICISREGEFSADKILSCESFLNFDLINSSLTFEKKMFSNWNQRVTEDKNFNFTKDDSGIKLNGRQTELANREIEEIKARTAVSSDREFVLAGDMSNLYLFDKQGNKRWKTINDDFIDEVNLSKDGKLAVASFFNGIVRWYRMSDGQEIVALFADKTKKRWILWTPSGILQYFARWRRFDWLARQQRQRVNT